MALREPPLREGAQLQLPVCCAGHKLWLVCPLGGSDWCTQPQLPLCCAGQPLFREFTLEVAPGKSAMLMGPNGCGKSSLFRVGGAQAAGVED